jgi:2-desacetyl-2-hydroxyethyl bacteriochlorophyllide A dehydrogenase
VGTIAWLEGPHRLSWRQETLPAEPPADGHLCETVVSAISPGTELGAWQGLPPLRPGTGYPRLQGYCNVARVVASGADAKAAQPGDLVLSFTSHRDRFVLADGDVLLVLPARADPGRIAVSYLFHLGYNAVLGADVRPGSRVLVLGLGALGLTSVALAHVAGAHVTAISDHDVPQAKARKLGAEWAGPRAEQAERKAVLGAADVVILTTNGWADWNLALQAAAAHGVISVLGFPGRGQPAPDFNPLDSAQFYVKQLRIQAAGLSPEFPDARGFLRFNERDNLRYIAGLITEGRLDADVLISGRYPAAQLTEAYAALEARRDSPVTYLLDWQ